jgi:hypothetical protein
MAGAGAGGTSSSAMVPTHAGWRRLGSAASGLVIALICAAPPRPAHAQEAAPASATETTWHWSAVNLTRLETWRCFEPPAGGGDPTYAFVANRLRLGVNAARGRAEVSAAVQYVQFAGLPAGASGPGTLGTGALYYQHAGTRHSRGLWPRTANLRVRLPRGLVLQGGRFGYTSGAEAASGRPKIEAVKRARLDSRLLGEFEWSLYQRTFDGVRGDIDRPAWHLTGAWLKPTQGGFEERAGRSLSGIEVAAATLVLRPGVAVPGTDLSLSAYRYDDARDVSARPDNTGQPAPRVDVGIATLGAAAVGSAATGAGELDWLAWLAWQRGSWYGQPHRAWSLALEAGHQWQAPWQPWLRAGYLEASGDADPSDGRHATFFPMLPTVRKYSMTTAYSTMNLRDVFAEVIVRPAPRVAARVDLRRLWLADRADLWYAGSGATENRGAVFGYAGRRSGGSTDLAPLAVQSALDVTLTRHWSANAFAAVIRGGDVVAASFAGRWLRFVYLEQAVQW